MLRRLTKIQKIARDAVVQLRADAAKQIGRTLLRSARTCDPRGIPVTDLLGCWLPWLEECVLEGRNEFTISSDHRWTRPYIDDYWKYANALRKILGQPFRVEFDRGSKYSYIFITWGKRDI